MPSGTLGRLALFAPTAVGVYHLLPARLRRGWLLLASAGFCALWSPLQPLIVMALAAAVYALSRRMAGRRGWLAAGIALNVLALAALKYIPAPAESGVLAVLLPIGLSFRVLELIAYLVDVHSGRMEPAASLPDFLLFALYFPKLVAGPIERARAFLPKLTAPRRVGGADLSRGFTLIVVGLLRKAAIADVLTALIPPDLFSAPGGFSSPDLLAGLLAYAFALYNDFAGYTAIARGISALLGIELSPNFQQPYFARSITEFWNRWHMSFSFWLRDYLFFPISRALAGRLPDRRHPAHVIVPPLVTMTLSGLWHAASPGMLLWGWLHAAMMIGWRLPSLGRPVTPPDRQPRWRQIGGAILLFALVALAWIPFRDGVGAALASWRGLLVWRGALAAFDARLLLPLIPALALDGIEARRGELAYLSWPLPARAGALALALLILLAALTADLTSTAFVYQGF